MASKKNDCEILFIGPVEENEFYKDIKNKKLVHKIWNFNHYVRSIFKAVKTMKPDIIHFQFELRRFGLFKIGIKLTLLIFLCYIFKVKVVVTLHDVYVAKEGGNWTLFEHQDVPIPRIFLKILVKLFFRFLGKFCAKIIIYSQIGKEALINYYNFPHEKIESSNLALTSYVETTETEKKKKLENLFKDKKIILHFGSISPRKGYETALNSMKIISKKIPHTLYVIVGLTNIHQKEYEKSLRNLIEEFDLKRNVYFAGFLDDDETSIIFDIADIALYLYKPGSYGSMAIHHAVQHSTPTIATDTEFFKEILGPNALYIDPDNVNELTTAITELLTDTDFSNQLRESMKLIKGKFSWKKTAEETMQVYDKIYHKKND